MTAVETTKEKWCEAEIYRIAGDIALKSPEPDTAKAQAYFERAVAVARQQQAKSWELLAAMSMARLWRDQGKPQQARDLLAPVYGWFTEGHNTRDLKEAKALLEERCLTYAPPLPLASRVRRRIIARALLDAEEPALLVAVDGIHRVVQSGALDEPRLELFIYVKN